MGRLARVRQGIAARLWTEGLARTLWLLIGLAAIDLVFDWLFRMDRPQRAIMLALAAGILSWAVYRTLIRPLGTPASDDSLALQLEAANPRLGQALITSLQLSRYGESQCAGLSPAIVQQAIANGVKIADELSFGEILDSRRFARNALLLLAGASFLVGGAVALPFVPTLRIWFSRNVLLSRASWPQETYLTIDRLGQDGAVAFPRGGDWMQIITVSPQSTVVPDVVYFESRGAGSANSRRSVAMHRSSDRQFETAFTGVTESFEFRVRGGDAITEWTRAVPVAPPALSELTLSVIPPRYTGLASDVLPPGQSPYQILPGSSLGLSAVANKRLQTAELIRGEFHWPLLTSGFASKHLAGQIPAADLTADSYSIRLVDTLGLTGNAVSFGLQWRPDQAPQVTAKLLGIGGVVLPQAQIPFSCQVKDDYGIASFAVVMRTNREDDNLGDHPRTLPIHSLPTLGQPGEPTKHRELAISDAIDLIPLDLAPGTNLAFRFDAGDNDNLASPNMGHSTEFSLRVVTEAEFRGDLLRREKVERQELELLVKSQDDLLTDCRALVAANRSPSAFTSEREDLLPKIHRGQRLIGQKLTAMADRLTALAAEVRNNRLPDPTDRLQNRLNKEIAAPLKNLAAQDIALVVQSLDRVRLTSYGNSSYSNSANDRATTLAEIVNQQHEIFTRLKQVLDQMTSSEGFQEAIDLLYEIQKAQGEVFEQTNQAREERIRKILEGRP